MAAETGNKTNNTHLKNGSTTLKVANNNFLQPPGMMRNMRSPSRESIASDFSVMSISSHFNMADNAHRRKRLQYLTKSRETLNSAAGYDGISLNVSVDIPLMTRQPEHFLIPGQNSFVKPQQLTRSFSFSDMRSNMANQPEISVTLDGGPTALSDPSLSVNSDFDDEISMFFDDKGEPINFRNNNQNEEGEDDDEKAEVDEEEIIPIVPLTSGKRNKLRQRIKRKFLNFSFNELLHRRKSKKSPLPPLLQESDRQTNSNSPSPKPEKKVINVFPDQTNVKTLTSNDIEREQGRALSKYSRNLMIFNWLHNTEETWFQNQMQ